MKLPVTTWRSGMGRGTRVARAAVAAAVSTAFAAFLIAQPDMQTPVLPSAIERVELQLRVVQSSDDAQQTLSGGRVLAGSTLALGFSGTTLWRWTGLRFQNVAIPPGATVTNAYVQFRSATAGSGSVSPIIYAQDSDNAPTFTTASNNIGGRSLTAASVTWSMPSWTASAEGASQRTPNISTLVQAVIDRPGWSAGNALALILSIPTNTTGIRRAYSFDGNANYAPLLVVQYEVETGHAVPPQFDFAVASVADRLSLSGPPVTLAETTSTHLAGCALSADTQQVLVLSHDPPAIRFYALDGTSSVRSIALTGFDSPEGLCLVDRAAPALALVEGTSNTVILLPFDSNTTSIAKSEGIAYTPAGDFTNAPPGGLSGIASASTNVFYAVRESAPMAVWRVTLTGSIAVATAPFDAETVLDGVCSNLTDIAYDPATDRLLLLSATPPLLIECEMDGTILATHAVDVPLPGGVTAGREDLGFAIVGGTNRLARYTASPPARTAQEGSTVDIPIRLSAPYPVETSVDVTVTSATAVAGLDFLPSFTNVVFPAGVTSRVFRLYVLSDAETEPIEALRATLANAANGATIGRERAFDVTIEANEARELTVLSAHGATVPPVGTSAFPDGAAVDCYVEESPVVSPNGATQFVCTGWTDAASATSGTGTNTVLTLFNDTTLTWFWTTNVWLGAGPAVGGSVLGANRWFALESAAEVWAWPLADFEWTGWTGDTQGAATNGLLLTLAMDAARQVAPVFAPRVDTNGVVPPPLVQFVSSSTVERMTLNASTNLFATPASNVVGFCSAPDRGGFFVLTESPSALLGFTADGVFTGEEIALDGFAEPSAVTAVSDELHAYAIADAATNVLTILALPPGVTNVHRSAGESVAVVVDGGAIPGTAISGLDYDPGNRAFLATRASSPMAVIRIPRDALPHPGAVTLFDAQATLSTLCSGLAGIAADVRDGRLVLLSSDGARLIECDMDGNVLGWSSPPGIADGVDCVLAADRERIFVLGGSGTLFDLRIGPPRAEYSEGQTVRFELSLSWAPTASVSVAFAATGITASAADFTPATGRVDFVAGQRFAGFDIYVPPDNISEPDEVFQVLLEQPLGLRIGRDDLFDVLIPAHTTRTVTLTSPRGAPNPPTGVYYVADESPFAFSMPVSTIPDGTRTQYVCTGWIGDGSIPSADGTSGSFAIDEDSSIAWVWKTNVWLDLAETGGGAAIGAEGWRPLNFSNRIDAVVFESYSFDGWTGETPAEQQTDRPLWLLMDRARSITGIFSVAVSPEGTLAYPRMSFDPPYSASRFAAAFNTNLQGNVTDNISACVIMPDTGELLTLANRGDLIADPPTLQVFDTNGVFRREITMIGFDDTEGICLVNPASNLYAIVEEVLGTICFVTIASNTTSIARSAAEIIDTGIRGGNNGMEGIAYDPLNDCYYLVKERIPMAVYRLTLDDGMRIRELFNAPAAFAGLCTDLSDLHYDTVSGRLFILSHEGRRLIECDLHGRVYSSLLLPSALTQPEGIAFSSDRRTLYIVGEPNHYFRFDWPPPSSSVQEGAALSIPVWLSWPWTNSVQADFTLIDRGATPGADVTPATGLVAFAQGATGAVIAISIPIDDQTEPAEGVRLVLTNFVNSVAGINDGYDTTIAANTALTLNVSSAFGGSVPPPGSHVVNRGQIVQCMVTNSPLFSGALSTQLLCVGWVGTDSVPATGTATSTPAFEMLENSSIDWLWGTNVHLTVGVTGSGAVDRATGWYPYATNLPVAATADDYHRFSHWSGDVPPADTNSPAVALSMLAPRSVTAAFLANLATNGVPVWWLAGFYGDSEDFDALALSDTDEDGHDARLEYIAGTVPTNAQSILRVLDVRAESGGFRLAWPVVAQRLYAVERTAPMGSVWSGTTLTNDMPPAPSGTNVYTDATPPVPPLFYRIRATRTEP